MCGSLVIFCQNLCLIYIIVLIIKLYKFAKDSYYPYHVGESLTILSKRLHLNQSLKPNITKTIKVEMLSMWD